MFIYPYISKYLLSLRISLNLNVVLLPISNKSYDRRVFRSSDIVHMMLRYNLDSFGWDSSKIKGFLCSLPACCCDFVDFITTYNGYETPSTFWPIGFKGKYPLLRSPHKLSNVCSLTWAPPTPEKNCHKMNYFSNFTSYVCMYVPL